MLVLPDSNLFISALLSPHGPPGRIYDAWLLKSFRVVTCQQQIDEVREASRNPKFRNMLQPPWVGSMLNHAYGATVWPEPLPGKHEANDPADSFLPDLIAAAQPDYAVTGDKRSGLLQMGKLGRAKRMRASFFCVEVLHLQTASALALT